MHSKNQDNSNKKKRKNKDIDESSKKRIMETTQTIIDNQLNFMKN